MSGVDCSQHTSSGVALLVYIQKFGIHLPYMGSPYACGGYTQAGVAQTLARSLAHTRLGPSQGPGYNVGCTRLAPNATTVRLHRRPPARPNDTYCIKWCTSMCSPPCKISCTLLVCSVCISSAQAPHICDQTSSAETLSDLYVAVVRGILQRNHTSNMYMHPPL